eukprot:6197623-Pleurochrysis_carterae.AAC.1
MRAGRRVPCASFCTSLSALPRPASRRCSTRSSTWRRHAHSSTLDTAPDTLDTAPDTLERGPTRLSRTSAEEGTGRTSAWKRVRDEGL